MINFKSKLKMNRFRMLIVLFLFISQFNYSQTIFETKADYLKETVKRTGFDKDKIYLLNREDIRGFIDDVLENRLNVFYGIVYKGEVYSVNQLENKSCWGQFAEMMKSLNTTNNKKVEDFEYLKNISFKNDKKTIVFIYSTIISKGNIRANIKPILKEIKDDDSYDYVVLSLDYSKIRKY